MPDFFYEPIQILEEIKDGYGAEMSREDSAFLCGLLRKYRPGKILELGVAAGGTTAIMLNCCRLLQLDTTLYSVDTMEHFYQDATLKTGYLADRAEARIREAGAEAPPRKLYTGGIYLDFADEIGGDIDMAVIDTVHSLPGELLDFLSVYPALKKGSIVVLHDICLNHLSDLDTSFATKVLFDTVTADKIIKPAAHAADYPNIAAFRITDDTDRYLKDVFSALTLTWKYIPEERHIALYRQFFAEHYAKDMQDMFQAALSLNQRTMEKRWLQKIEKGRAAADLHKLLAKAAEYENRYIYGYGKYGKTFAAVMEQAGLKINGFVVSDNQALPQDAPEKVQHLGDIEDKTALFIIAVADNIAPAIKAELDRYGIRSVLAAGDILTRLM